MGLLAWLCLGAARADAPAAVDTNLLRLPSAHVERSTAGLDDLAALPALADGDPASVARARAAPAAPLDVVYGFGGATVTAERLQIQLPDQASTGRVEILVSTLSPQAGFRSLRGDPLKAGVAVQEFRFQPAAARWIMLRFTPAPGRGSVEIGEVQVLGHEGEPASSYAFKQSPAAAFEVLARLKTVAGADVALSADERSLFADAADGRLDQWSFEDAALIAGGLTAAEQRKPYLDKLARLEQAAAGAVGSGGAPFERGGRLLKWLYRGGTLKAYARDQTDLPALLDSGRYNCVSSALLYAVLGQRLGLDVRAIEVPDHAFAVLYDGSQHADVETTIESGFNPDRDPRSLGFFARLTGYSRPLPDQRELRREVSAIGLAASVYYNRGVEDGEAGRNTEALGDYFRALSLDPENAVAVKNTLATMANWSVQLIRAHQFHEAVQELAVGLALAPDDARLNQNHLAAWQQWATAEIQAGRRDAALEVLRNAAQAAPKGGFEAMQTWVYINPAEQRASSGDWDGAIAIVDPARALLQGRQLEDLQNYEAGLYNDHALQLIGRKQWAQAQALYADAEARLPGIEVLRQNEKYVWSSWVVERESAGDMAAMLDIARRGHARYGDDPILAGNEKAAWIKASASQADQADFAAALKTAAEGEARFPGDPDLSLHERALWVNWSKARADAGDWAQAIDICERGLKAFPGEPLLENNERAAWFHAGQVYFDGKQWREAADLYARARARFPADGELAHNELAALSNWGYTSYQDGQWQQSIDAYAQARQRFPEEPRLGEAERSAWLSWVKALADQNQWNAALATAERGLQRFPDDSALLQARAVCRDHQGKT